MISEIKRKLFHLIGFIYVAGILWIPRPTFLLLVGLLLGADTLAEILRLRSARVASLMSRYFGGLFRSSEENKFTGIFWMLLGVFTTAALVPSNRLAATIFLYVIFGDGVASLAGKGFKGPHWPNSDKRLSGSLACLLMCLLVGTLMLRPLYGWSGVVGGALAATALEFGVIPLNDNFTIPAGSSVAFLLLYHLKPAFLSL